jgi:hypothetical protein
MMVVLRAATPTIRNKRRCALTQHLEGDRGERSILDRTASTDLFRIWYSEAMTEYRKSYLTSKPQSMLIAGLPPSEPTKFPDPHAGSATNHFPNLPAVATTPTRNIVPGGWYTINPVLHACSVLLQFDHLLLPGTITQVNERDRQELRSSQSPILRHPGKAFNIELRQILDVKNEVLNVGA